MIGVILRQPRNHEPGAHVCLTKSVLIFNLLACLSVCTVKQPSQFPASTRCTKTNGTIKSMLRTDCVLMAHCHKHRESLDRSRVGACLRLPIVSVRKNTSQSDQTGNYFFLTLLHCFCLTCSHAFSSTEACVFCDMAYWNTPCLRMTWFVCVCLSQRVLAGNRSADHARALVHFGLPLVFKFVRFLPL